MVKFRALGVRRASRESAHHAHGHGTGSPTKTNPDLVPAAKTTDAAQAEESAFGVSCVVDVWVGMR